MLPKFYERSCPQETGPAGRDIIPPRKDGEGLLNRDWLKSQMADPIRTNEKGTLLTLAESLNAEFKELQADVEAFEVAKQPLLKMLDDIDGIIAASKMKNVTPTTDPEHPASNTDPDLCP